MKKIVLLTMLLLMLITLQVHAVYTADQYVRDRTYFGSGNKRLDPMYLHMTDAANSGNQLGTGKAWYVDSGVANEGDGTSWTRAFDTVDEAINASSADSGASRGDVIWVAQGHAESGSAADLFDADIAGITIAGFGNGALRPTFTFADTDTTVAIGAANVRFDNLRFLAGISAVVVGIDIENGSDDCTISNCEFPEPTTSSFEFVRAIINTTSDRLTISGCTVFSADADGATNFLDLDGGVVNGLTFIHNTVIGDYDEGIVHSDDIDLEQELHWNRLTNLDAGEHCIEYTANATGHSTYNTVQTDVVGTSMDLGVMSAHSNTWSSPTADQEGVTIFRPVTGINQLNASTITAINDGLTGMGFRSICEVDAGASTITAIGLAGFGNDYFNTGWSVICILNADAPGTAQEGEIRDIEDYVSATGVFTVDDDFSAAVTTNDEIYVRRNEELNFDDPALAGTSGVIWYLDDGGSGGDGRTWQTAFTTLALAEAAMSAGDICYVGANHNENITAGGDTINVVGVTFIGLGEGDARPLFDFDAAADELTVDAAGVTLKNLRFRPGATVVVACLRIEDAGLGATIEDCAFEDGEAADDEFIDVISVDTLAAGLTVKNCVAFNANATAGDSDTWLNLDEATIADATAIGNTVFGTFDEAPIWGGAAVPTNVNIRGNTLTNSTTGQLAIEFAGAATGVIGDNKLAGDTYGAILDPGSARAYGNTQTVGINASAIDVPLKLGQRYVLTASVDEIDATLFDVQNGEILVHTFVGLVDVVIGGGATTCRIDLNADDGAAFDVEFSTAVNIETDVAGTRYVFTDANPGVLTPLLKGGTEGSATLHSPWLVPEGLLIQEMSADPGGAAGDHITWYMEFTPLVEGVVVVPGT